MKNLLTFDHHHPSTAHYANAPDLLGNAGISPVESVFLLRAFLEETGKKYSSMPDIGVEFGVDRFPFLLWVELLPNRPTEIGKTVWPWKQLN